MFKFSKTILKKVLFSFIVVALTYSNFLLVGTNIYKGFVSYATTDNIQHENEEATEQNAENYETSIDEESEIIEGVTKALLNVDNLQWEAGKENIVSFQITLDTISPKMKAYKNPIFILELPECVEKVNVGNSLFNLENDGGAFTQKKVSVVPLLGTKYVVIKLTGEQTGNTIIEKNTIINLSLAFRLKESINEIQEVKLYYRNNTPTAYESGMSYGTDVVTLDANNIKNVVVINSLEEENEENIEENAPTLRTRGFVTASTNGTITANENTTGAEMVNALLNNNSILLNYNTVAHNKYIYCRNKTQVLPRSGNFSYIIDGNSVTYPNSNNQGAAWAYLFAKNYNCTTGSTITDSDMQNLYWAATGYIQNGHTNPNLVDNGNAKIKEAIAYGEVISNNGGALTVANSINCDEELSDLKNTSEAAYSWTYGPIKIESDYWEYNNELKAGISEFYVYAKDKNNNEIQPSYILIYDDITEDESYYNYKWHGIFNGSSSLFTYENEKNYRNEHLNDPAIKPTLKENEMIKLNQVCAQGKEFYIHFNQEIESFRIVVKYKTLNATVELIPIKSADSYTGEPTGCVKHSDKVFTTSLGTNRDYIYIIDNKTYEFKERGSNWLGTTHPNNGLIVKNGVEYYRVYDSYYAGTGCRHGDHEVVTSPNSGDNWLCPTCGLLLKGKMGELYNNAVNVYQTGYSLYKPWTCEYSSNCGSTTTISADSIQRLIVINPTLSEGTRTIDKEIETNNELPIVNTVEFKIEKYNINDLNKEEKEQSNGASFAVTAKQGDQIIYSNTVTNNAIVSIPTTSTEDMFVAIEEKEAPNGYNKIQKPINYIIKYKALEDRFDPTFAPSQSEWEVSGFEFGNWQHIDSDNAFPNTYRSESMDIIEVDKREGEPYVIKVYDDPKPIKITLEKVNSYYSNTREHLQGAKFTLKAIQKNGNEYTSLNIIAGNNEAAGTLENILANQLIQIKPKYVSADKKIYITIEETEAPNGYIKISRPIIACYIYNSESASWGFKYCVTDENDKNIFNNQLDSSYTLWSWVQTDYDWQDDGTYSSKLPNVYCVMNDGSSNIVVSERTMMENNVTDIIYVESNTTYGGNTIKVYNTKNVFSISGNVWLDENTIINNKVQGAPNGIKDALETGVEGIKVSLYNSVGVLKDETTTDENGNYSFTNIEYSETGYFVKFVYDGLNYENTISLYDSVAIERTNRLEFNKKFYTIKENAAYHKNGNLENYITLDYTCTTENGVDISSIKTKDDNGDLKQEFQMYATTGIIYNSTNNVNFGLIKRNTLDLAVTTGVANKNNFKLRNYLNNSPLYNNNSNNNMVISIDEANNKAYITYKVDIINQGTEDVKNLEIAYYYDLDFELDLDATVEINNSLNSCEDFYDCINNNDSYKALIYSSNVNVNKKTSQTIYLVFKTNLEKVMSGQQFINQADIISYSSEQGLIDIDSQPGRFHGYDLDFIDRDLRKQEDDNFKSVKQIIINN